MNLKHVWLAGLIALPGCAAARTQDVEFVRGCWAMRAPPDGPVEAMLRLLPEGADGPTYRGIVREYSGSPANPQGLDTVALIFSRDGKWLDIDNHHPDSLRKVYNPLETGPVRLHAATPPDSAIAQATPDMTWAAFAETGAPGWIVATGAEEALTIYVVHPDGAPGQTLFMGDRDGCD